MMSLFSRGTLGSVLFLLQIFSFTAAANNPFLAVDNAQVQVFATQNVQSGWPVMLSARPVNLTSSVLQSLLIKWSFPDQKDNSSTVCTTNATMNAPCLGNVVDHTFQQPGNYTVQLDMTSGGSSVISQSFTVQILSAPVVKVQRYEIRSLSPTAWETWVDGMYTLFNFGVINHLAKIHQTAISKDSDGAAGRTLAHSSPGFLPWHRSLMRIVEINLQTAVNDAAFALPYWSWDTDVLSASIAQSTALNATYYGGTGDADGFLQDGPFCASTSATCTSAKTWVFPVANGGPALKRNITSSTTLVSTAAQVNAMIANEDIYDSPTYDRKSVSGFRPSAEGFGKYGQMHNGLHNALGGTMARVAFSLHDPAFMGHHANVDRIYYLWQMRKNCHDVENGCYRPRDNASDVTSDMPGATLINGMWRLPGQHWSDPTYPWGLKPSDSASFGTWNTWMEYMNVTAVYSHSPQPISTPVEPAASTSSSTPSITPLLDNHLTADAGINRIARSLFVTVFFAVVINNIV